MEIGVPAAAEKLGRNPETIRRWIREGKLPARKVGTQHFIDEEELAIFETDGRLAVPAEWETTVTGEPMPNWVRIIHRSRGQH